MRVSIDLPDTLVSDIMKSFPEAGMCLTCVEYDYKGMRFTFWDREVTPDTAEKSVVPATVQTMELSRSGLVENMVTYRLTRTDLNRGMRVMVQMLAAGQLNGLDMNGHAIGDAGNWDALAADALAQCAIFGDVIYG